MSTRIHYATTRARPARTVVYDHDLVGEALHEQCYRDTLRDVAHHLNLPTRTVDRDVDVCVVVDLNGDLTVEVGSTVIATGAVTYHN